MATNDESGPPQPPVEPRPMIIRVLAALAIVGILVFSLWVVLRAGHNINKKVNKDLDTSSVPSTRFHVHFSPAVPLSAARLRADAAVLQRRARSLGYTAYATTTAKEIEIGTTRKLTAPDVGTLVATGTLENRVVQNELPAGPPPPTNEGTVPAGHSCVQLVDAKTWFWDAAGHHLCYQLGPSVLDGSAVASAKATYEPQANGWGVDATYRDDLFVQKIGRPYVGKNVAIVFAGDVISAPVIEQGITGSHIRISGGFNEASARSLAAVLASGPLPDHLVPG